MNLLECGTRGYQIGALGILAWAISFLVIVRWWTNLLGKVMAFIFTITSVILVLSAYRSLTQDDSDGFLAVRVIAYWVFGIGIWAGVLSFYWFQFFTPRMKVRTTRRKDKKDEQEGNVAGSRSGGYGHSDDRAGGDR